MKRNDVVDPSVDPMELAESMINEVDKDGDGQIDIEEFVEMMRKNSNAGGQLGNRMTMLAKNILLAHQRKLEKNIVGEDLWMINPTEWKHAVWDIFVSVLIMITVVTMPLTIAWEEMNDSFFVMNVTFDCIFLLDVCKNFCTGFVDDNDAVIMDAAVVRKNYMTGFFLTDVVSSIPLDLILKLVSRTFKLNKCLVINLYNLHHQTGGCGGFRISFGNKTNVENVEASKTYKAFSFTSNK